MKTKTCPICDWEIKDAGIEVTAAGETLVVCCEDCAEKAKRARSSRAKRER